MRLEPSASPCDVADGALERFRSGLAAGPERREILAHLLRGCERCREAAQAQRTRSESQATAVRLEPLLRDLSQRADRLVRELDEGERLLSGFLAHPPARQWTLLRNSPRHRSFGFATALLEACFEAIYDDPRRALDLGRMAAEIAEQLDTAEAPAPRLLHDLRARAAAHVANAERATGDLAAAERSLVAARSEAALGSLDPMIEAELLYFEASLARGQRRLERALGKIRRSRRIYRDLGERHLEGRTLLNLASIHLVRGDAELAFAANLEALELVDASRDPRLALALRHNTVWNAMECGRIDFAVAKLEEFRSAYAALGDRASVARFVWLSGRLAEAQELPARALERLDAARASFVELELPYELAMVSLDLARVHVEQGRVGEARRIAAETLEIFRALGVEREAIAAWLVFQGALAAESLSRELVLRLADYYQAAKANPELRFEA